MSAHLDVLRAVKLDRRLRGLDDLAQRTLRVAEHVGLLRGHTVDEQVLADLFHQVLQLHVARMDERDFEAMEVQVCQSGTGEDARRSVVVGVDVGDHKTAQPWRSEELERSLDRGEGFIGVHPAIQQVGVLAVGEEEDVDEAVLERDWQAQLEDARRNLGQSEFSRHPGILAEPSKMSSGPYSNVLKTNRLLHWRSRCPKSR